MNARPAFGIVPPVPTDDSSPWLLLSLTTGLGPILTQRLVARCGSADAACGASLAVLRTVEGVGSVGAERIFAGLRESRSEAPRVARQADRAGLRVVDFDDDEYPPLLKLIPDPPAVLYVRGAIEPRDLNGVGVVGSRKCSLYGREQAGRFGALLAGAGFTVVSGGARGIDTAAHDGAMSSTVGRTVAVLGCGADRVYPPENGRLFDRIAGGRGAVVSEYPPGTPPVADNFPRRNRIISGMTRGTLVVEADVRSGALITARQANEDQGRVVFALPGRVDSPTSNGTHKLIRDGATLVTGLDEIVDDLPPFPDQVRETRGGHDVGPNAEAAHDGGGDRSGLFAGDSPSGRLAAPLAGRVRRHGSTTGRVPSGDPVVHAPQAGRLNLNGSGVAGGAGHPTPTATSDPTLTPEQRRLLDALTLDGASVDDLSDRSGLATHVVLGNLTMMSLKGLVRRVDGQTYARKPTA